MHAGRLARGVTTAGSNIGHHAMHLQLAHTLCTLKLRTRRLEYHTSPTQHTAAKRPCGAVFLPKQQPNPFITCHNWCATTQPGCVLAHQKPCLQTPYSPDCQTPWKPHWCATTQPGCVFARQKPCLQTPYSPDCQTPWKPHCPWSWLLQNAEAYNSATNICTPYTHASLCNRPATML
jgi:hypothetical protein